MIPMKRFLIYNRIVLLATAIIIQLAVIITVILRFNQFFEVFYGINVLIGALAFIWVLNNKSNPAYKIAWIVPILLFPIFGGLFYIFFGGNRTGQRTKKRMKPIMDHIIEALTPADSCLELIQQQNPNAGNQSRYIQEYSYYPPYRNTEVEYLPSGEVKFERLMEELKKAESYIFLEYFIIDEGYMWKTILKLLKEKAAQGVDVRVIYDDFGCLATLPYQYDKKLESMGIKCGVFHPVVPVLSSRLNNRDHRKIVVIDGHTGFTGGINLADEYINRFEKYGHWKDASIMIKGEAVWNLTVMFLSMWDYIKGIKDDGELYQPVQVIGQSTPASNGFVQPFGDSPLDDEPVSEAVYLNLINKAERYVYITTPYLIIGHEMVTALCLAAKSGVDVRIITPHHPDKWYVHTVSRSYYRTLVESGVKVYEYLPGFIHSKTFVVDDKYGVVGTINLDYRSLYLHFECGVWLYRCGCILDIKSDFEETLKVCQEFTLDDIRKIHPAKTMLMSVLRLFAPLM